MFKIGATVIHPVHGFCNVRGLAQDEHTDIEDQVFILKPFKPAPGDFKILLSVDEVKKAGVRYPVDKKEISNILKVLQSDPEELMDDRESGYFVASEKIRSGNIYKMAEVARDMNAENKATFTQQRSRSKLAETAGNRIVDEIAYSAGITKNKAKNMVENALKKIKRGGNNGRK